MRSHKPLAPVLVTHLFPDERAALLDLLHSLDAEQVLRTVSIIA